MSRTVKGGRNNGGGNPEYWSKRPHNRCGSFGVGKYQKQRTAKTERRIGGYETRKEARE